MIRPTFSWNDYFSGTSIETTLSGEHKTRQNPSVSSVYVLNCLFNGCTSGSNGGALYCASVTSLLIESSSFFSCKTTSSGGGAIYFSNGNSQCVLYCVCGYDCCSTYTGGSNYQFAYIYVNNGASSKNYINYSSISRCVNERTNSYHTFQLYNGKICCPSVNSSMNKCQQYSGMYCIPFVDSSYVTCSVSYSSITDNNNPGYTCIYLERAANHEMKCCNILRNLQNTSTWGTIYTYGNLAIKDSCILENRATYIFRENNPSCTITLSNCTVDKTTSSGGFTIQNTVTKSFIHGLNHMSTQNCKAEYDAIGTLTAVPFVTSPIKKIFCYTCNCQGRISVSLSTIRLLMFTFIHLNPSLYC